MFSFLQHFHERNLAAMFQAEKEHVICGTKPGIQEQRECIKGTLT